MCQCKTTSNQFLTYILTGVTAVRSTTALEAIPLLVKVILHAL